MLNTIDRGLEMALYLSIPLGTSGSLFLDENEQVPMGLHFSAKDIYYDFFVKESLRNYYELYQYYNPIHFGDFVLLAQRVELPMLVPIRKKIYSIPTIVMGGLFSQKGNVMMDFRFHKSDIKRVGELVRLLVSINEDIKIIKMEQSEGLRAKYEEMETRSPMSVVEFSYVDERDSDRILEWKGIVDPTGAISYSLDGAGEVSNVDISNAPITPLLLSVLRDRIPVAGYFENRKKGEVHSMMILPTFMAKHFLVRYFNETKNIAGINLLKIDSYCNVKNSL